MIYDAKSSPHSCPRVRIEEPIIRLKEIIATTTEFLRMGIVSNYIANGIRTFVLFLSIFSPTKSIQHSKARKGEHPSNAKENGTISEQHSRLK